LTLDVFFFALFQEFYAVLIDDWFEFDAAAGAEFDIVGVAQHKPSILHVFVDGVVEHIRKLVDFQFFRHESGILDVDYILDKDFLASLCELDNIDQYFGDIIR